MLDENRPLPQYRPSFFVLCKSAVARIPASLIGFAVLGLVLFLLHGWSGAWTSLCNLVIQTATEFCGGGDHAAVHVVLWQTLPLTLAIAICTFCMVLGWLQMREPQSWFWVSVIVIVGAGLGNAAYETTQIARIETAVASEPDEHTILADRSKSLIDGAPKPGGPFSLASAQLPQSEKSTDASPVSEHLAGGERRLSLLDWEAWLTPPDLNSRPQKVEPIQVIPIQVEGVLGMFADAINQLVAYAWNYQPRMFIAALLVGVYLGWQAAVRLRPVITGLQALKRRFKMHGSLQANLLGIYASASRDHTRSKRRDITE